jgi:hypothetical protein
MKFLLRSCSLDVKQRGGCGTHILDGRQQQQLLVFMVVGSRSGSWAVKTTPEAAPRGGDRPAARTPRLPADILHRGKLPRPRPYRSPRRSLRLTVAPPWWSSPATRTARGAHVPLLLLARSAPAFSPHAVARPFTGTPARCGAGADALVASLACGVLHQVSRVLPPDGGAAGPVTANGEVGELTALEGGIA